MPHNIRKPLQMIISLIFTYFSSDPFHPLPNIPISEVQFIIGKSYQSLLEAVLVHSEYNIIPH